MTTRNTIQLSVVHRALCELANHPTADEVYARVHRQHSSISKATVYRALNKLVDRGDARKVLTPQGADRFDHNAEAHAHVHCMQCGAVGDVSIVLEPFASEEAQRQSGFCVFDQSVHFMGLCPECTGQEEDTPHR